MRRIWLFLLLAGPALADEVELRNGHRLQGIVTEKADRVILRMDCGTVTLSLDQVKTIRYRSGPLRALEERQGRLRSGDIEGLYRLGLWARDQGLLSHARRLFRRVVALAPDHDGARRALGYHRVQGQWLTQDQVLAARGLVLHGGKWLPRTTVETLLREEGRLRQEERRMAALARQETDLRRYEIEARLRGRSLVRYVEAKARLERERLEAELSRVRSYRYRWTHLHTYGRFVFPCACARVKKK